MPPDAVTQFNVAVTLSGATILPGLGDKAFWRLGEGCPASGGVSYQCMVVLVVLKGNVTLTLSATTATTVDAQGQQATLQALQQLAGKVLPQV